MNNELMIYITRLQRTPVVRYIEKVGKLSQRLKKSEINQMNWIEKRIC